MSLSTLGRNQGPDPSKGAARDVTCAAEPETYLGISTMSCVSKSDAGCA